MEARRGLCKWKRQDRLQSLGDPFRSLRVSIWARWAAIWDTAEKVLNLSLIQKLLGEEQVYALLQRYPQSGIGAYKEKKSTILGWVHLFSRDKT